MCFLAKCGLNYTFSQRSGLEAQAGMTYLLRKSEDVSLANNASTIPQGVDGWEKKTNTAATAFAEARSLSIRPFEGEVIFTHFARSLASTCKPPGACSFSNCFKFEFCTYLPTQESLLRHPTRGVGSTCVARRLGGRWQVARQILKIENSVIASGSQR